MPSRRSGARAVARASLSIDGALALLDSHPLTHSLHVVVPSKCGAKAEDEQERNVGNAAVAAAADAPSPSLFDLLPKPPPYFCVPELHLAELATPEFISWAFPEEEETEGVAGEKKNGACGLAAPASLDAGGGAALSPEGRLVLALPGEEMRRAAGGGFAPGSCRRDPGGGGGGWYLSELFLTAGRKARARARARRRKQEEEEEEAKMEEKEEEGAAAAAAAAAATITATSEHRPLAKARARLAEATLPVPFALLPPGSSRSSSPPSPSSLPSSSPPLPPLPGAREVWPRERRRLRARAPLPSFPDFEAFFKMKVSPLSEAGSNRDRGEEMEVDEKEGGMADATTAATKRVDEEEEENNCDDEGGDDDRERLTETLEWLGLAASLSSPSVTLVESSSGSSEEGEGGKANFVDVCSFEGVLGSAFASGALRAAAAAVVATNSPAALPWAALVLVGFPDSPLSWTKATTAAVAKEGEQARKKTTTTAPEPAAVRLGPEACREHALFIVVVKAEGGSSLPPRFLAAVASGGGDGFAPSRLL